MKDDNDIPKAPTWLFITVVFCCAYLLLFMLTGCGTTPVLTEIKVAVPVECREKVPDRPVMPTEQFTEKPNLFEFTKAAQAEIERREGYEGQLRTAVEACTAPIQP